MAPVTVFLVAIACLLAATAAVRPLALRTGVPEAVWLIGLGVVLRATGLVSTATIAALAPFFAAIALIMVLFEAGRDMVFGAGEEQVGRARKLALAGAALTVPMVALFSQALSGLELLPVWSWTHALMLGALMSCVAPEVFAPTLYRRAHPALVGTLEREAALTGALAIAATAFCIDLLSLRVPAGKAYAAIAAGFGLGLAFGAFAGLLWITAIRRVGPGRGVYPYTLSAILALYVVTDTLGGIGALAVLVFGAVVSNAGPLVAALFRPRGAVVEAADEDFRAALDDHGRTVEITRVLLFTFIGLGLGPPWGLVAMGVVLGLLLVVLRLLAARLVLRKVDERTFSALALGWPRGMLVAGLAALPHAAAVPGTESLTTLVFSAIATTCAAFAVAISPLGHAHVVENMPDGKGAEGHGGKDMSEGARAKPAAPAPTVDEVLGGVARGTPSGGAPAGTRTLIAGASDGDALGGAPGETLLARASDGDALGGARGGTLLARASDGDALGVARGGTLSAREPAEAVRGGTLIPGEPVSGGTLIPGEPLNAGAGDEGLGGARGGTLIPGEPVSAGASDEGLGAARGGTLIPGEPVRGGTLIPGEPVRGGTLIPGEPVIGGASDEGLGAARGGTLIPGEPVGGVSTRTLLPEETVPAPLETSRFAPPGSRSTERTILRVSGPGAPELVRHVLISGPIQGDSGGQGAGTAFPPVRNLQPASAPERPEPLNVVAPVVARESATQAGPESASVRSEPGDVIAPAMGREPATVPVFRAPQMEGGTPSPVSAPGDAEPMNVVAPATGRESATVPEFRAPQAESVASAPVPAEPMNVIAPARELPTSPAIDVPARAPGASGTSMARGEALKEPALLELVNEALHEAAASMTLGHVDKDMPQKAVESPDEQKQDC